MSEQQPPQDDGLFIPEVRSWSRNKHHFLRRYIDAFTKAMKSKRWTSLHYIDLFSGAGIERIQEDGALEWASPLIAAQSINKFSQLHLCELDKKRFDALAHRLLRFQQPNSPQLLNGDANVMVKDVMNEIPPGTLSLAFLDPFGLHLHFDTLQHLAKRQVDLIIFFPDHVDALRNWDAIYSDQPNSNLDRVLGGAPWRERMATCAPDNWANALTDLYTAKISQLGYQEFEFERITKPDGRFLYKLIFCSKDKAGGMIWRKIALKKPDGQHSFNFEHE